MLKKTLKVLVLAFLSHMAMSAPCKGKLMKRKMPTVSGWVASWGAKAGLDLLNQYDEITYSFVDVTDQYIAEWAGGNDTTADWTGDDLMEDSRPPVLLSIGGWSLSKYFSGAVKEDNRAQFVASIVDLVVPRFSGVDLDWEYPGTLGLPCNEVDAADAANYLQFIKDLRVALRTRMKAKNRKYEPILSAAVPIDGFTGPDGNKLSDASAVKASDFVKNDALDFISIMSYDLAGFTSEMTGINQPWDAPDEQLSMKSSLHYWTKVAKVPAGKIQMGLPAYGKLMILASERGTELLNDTAYHGQIQPKELDKSIPHEAGQQSKYDYLLAHPFSDEPNYTVDRTCPNVTEARIMPTFREMIESKGMITKDTVASSGDNAAMADWKYHWDATALAPYLLNINPPENENVSENSERAHMVTYDSVKSFQVKAQKLAEYKDDAGNSLLGVKIWHIAGDTESGDLVKAVRKFWPKKS